MKYLFLCVVVLLPVFGFAQSHNEVTVGDQVIFFNELLQEESTTLYFKDGVLVASVGDGVSVVYENDQAVLEAFDADNDGVPDVFVDVDSAGEVTDITGAPSEWEKPEVVEFAELIEMGGGFAAAPQDDATDLIGSLDRIDIPGGAGIPKVTILLWLLILGGGYWWYKNKWSKSDNEKARSD